MYLNDKTIVKLNIANITHYQNYYDDINIGDIIEVFISELTSFSNSIIKVKCDSCECEK